MQMESNKYGIRYVGLRKFWRTSSLSMGAKVVLMDLLLYAGVDNVAFPSELTLASNHGRTDRRIRDYLDELRVTGLIRWKRGGVGSSNSYVFSADIYSQVAHQELEKVSADTGTGFPFGNGNGFPTNGVNLSESQRKKSQEIAYKKSPEKVENILSSRELFMLDKKGFGSAEEVAAYEVWQELESGNARAWFTTYLWAVREGLPAALFHQFRSEIKQDKQNIKNPGAVFRMKVVDWGKKKEEREEKTHNS